MTQWHSYDGGQVLSELETSLHQGLSEARARQRLERYGPNTLERRKKDSLAKRFFSQLKDPMILVLLGAAALSLAASGFQDWMDAGIILLIVAANAVISIVQEGRAERSLEALRRMAAPTAQVLRSGAPVRRGAEELVPGDIVLLEAGDLVPADGYLLRCSGLKTDESAMTGESVPVAKRADVALPPETALGDRVNLVLAGTVVTAGRGVCAVTATGMRTEMGRIAGLLTAAEQTEMPLQRRMAEVSKTLSLLCLLGCAVTFGVGLLRGRAMLDMFLTAVSLAVAAIPEGLPAIVTIVLALGLRRMAKRGAIVKKLPSVEALGCASVICSDKTGTLTQNKMSVSQVWTAGGARRQALEIGLLCSDVRTVDGKLSGDPTETALAELAQAEGLDRAALERRFPRRGELPFDSQRKLMSTVHQLPGGGFRVLVKGAPDVLLARCTRILAPEPRPMDAQLARRAERANLDMAGRALRVIAMAYKDMERLPQALTSLELEKDLTFAGLAGMLDPPRPEARLAVERCRRAGIRPVMITGDHKATAVAIAGELGILREGDLAVTGEELDFMSQALLEQEVERFSVYARVSPEHKMRIVQAWQKRGHVAAMTGDGVNDAPALKAADIGCAMGSGADVAKSAAEMILTDDNFATIVHAVEQGRGIYANIKKAIHYLLSCNIGEILTIAAATALNFPQMPLTPVQLLWLNLVTDSLPALALGMEPVERDVMDRPPRPAGEALFTRPFALRLLWQGCMVGGLTLGAWLLGAHVFASAAAANTMAFATLTLSQLFHAFDVRSEERSLFQIGLGSNKAMLEAFFIGLAMQMSVLCLPPLQRLFSVVFLTGGQWLAVLALAAAPVPICELDKAVRRRRERRRRADQKERTP
ncbi:MAG: cation-translocating P-type ATPase [Oscillospiraceae bacterium]|nr:cation-translocating P-type ATPase [Oscillospiraceae bacterium]